LHGPAKGTRKIDAKAETIACLAEQGPLNMYQIGKQTKIQYSSVHKAVNVLISERTIQELKTVKSQKNRSTRLLGLTFKGFMLYLLSYPKLPNVEPLSSQNEEPKQIYERYRKIYSAIWEEIKRLLKIMESNGNLLDYAILKEIRWLAKKNITIPWVILETADSICSHPPFTLDANSLIDKTQTGIRRLESEKTSLDNPVIRKAFSEDQYDNPFELNQRKLEHARQNLRSLLQLEDELWRRDFAKLFACRFQYLVGVKNMKNKELGVFFKQVAEKGRIEVEPAEKMANLFSGF
jgi:hypothetical protein